MTSFVKYSAYFLDLITLQNCWSFLLDVKELVDGQYFHVVWRVKILAGLAIVYANKDFKEQFYKGVWGPYGVLNIC